MTTSVLLSLVAFWMSSGAVAMYYGRRIEEIKYPHLRVTKIETIIHYLIGLGTGLWMLYNCLRFLKSEEGA